jgi:hypothetical protein
MNTNRFHLLALAAALLAPAALHAQFSQPVRDVENPSQNAFVYQGGFTITGTNNAHVEWVPASTVPLGKRWTIESVAFHCRPVPASSSISSATFSVRTRNIVGQPAQQISIPILMTRQGTVAHQISNTFDWVGSFTGRVYHDQIDSSTRVAIVIGRKPPTDDVPCVFSISGALTNLPLQ